MENKGLNDQVMKRLVLEVVDLDVIVVVVVVVVGSVVDYLKVVGIGKILIYLS